MREWKSYEKVEVLCDETKKHRLSLSCTWDDGREKCLFIMFNPSTANMQRCDRTLDRCCSFARAEGFGGFEVVNLFSYRTPSTKDLRKSAEPTLNENRESVEAAIDRANTAIVAWGGGVKPSEYEWVTAYAHRIGKQLYCLGTTAKGLPRHPLYVKKDTRLMAFQWLDKGISI